MAAEWLGPGVIRVKGKLLEPGSPISKDDIGAEQFKKLEDQGKIGAKAGRPPKADKDKE